MNKLNERLTLLKDNVDNIQTKYQELKAIHDDQQHQLLQKEYQIKALTNQNQFLESRLESHLHLVDNYTEQIEANSAKIQERTATIAKLEAQIEALEKDYTELQVLLADMKQELTEIVSLLLWAVMSYK